MPSSHSQVACKFSLDNFKVLWYQTFKRRWHGCRTAEANNFSAQRNRPHEHENSGGKGTENHSGAYFNGSGQGFSGLESRTEKMKKAWPGVVTTTAEPNPKALTRRALWLCAKPKKRLGLLEGKLTVPDDFDAPLPPELTAAFEGHAK
jgi:hypothetical protein